MPENIRVNIDPAEVAREAAAAAAAAAASAASDKDKPAPDALPSDQVPADPPAAPDVDQGRPEWLDPKFNSPEDLAKAYAELAKKLGAPNSPRDNKAAPAEATPLKVPETAEVKAAVDVVTKAGLDFVKLNETFVADGKLLDTDYAALEKQGIPKAMVDHFIAGQIAVAKANADATAKAAFDAAGGEEKYGQVIQWAAKGLDKDAIAAFNKTMDSNDPAAIKLAVTGLVATMVKSGGDEPSNLNVGEKGGGTPGYRSMAEVTRDMGDPRYETDPAYRARVEAKLARSTL